LKLYRNLILEITLRLSSWKEIQWHTKAKGERVAEKEKKVSNYTNIGKQYIEAHKKNHGKITVGEVRKEQDQKYLDNLLECAIKGKKHYAKKNYDKTFYVVVLIRRERIMKKVLRNGFTFRKTCPTPNYDQHVYRFNPKTEELEFLWLVPSPEDCKTLYKNRHLLELKRNQLLPYAIDFIEGRLYRKMKELNGETPEPGYKLKGKK
jgi:hypothetical protein